MYCNYAEVSTTHTHTHRLSFSPLTKCRIWYDRVLECKRRAHKDTKSVFAFVYRAYRKDEKYSQLLSDSEENGVVLRNMCELGETCGAGGEGGPCEAGGGGGGLLSLTSECQQHNYWWLYNMQCNSLCGNLKYYFRLSCHLLPDGSRLYIVQSQS